MSLLDALLLDAQRIDVWVALRSDGIKGSGTAQNPYNGTGPDNFDEVMGSLPEFTTVHLGPGIFETRGYSDDVSGAGWQVKKGLKLVGSGAHLTTLKLVEASTASTHYFAIGHASTTGSPPQPNLVDYCEVSDLSVNCNLIDPEFGANIACGAIRLKGGVLFA